MYLEHLINNKDDFFKFLEQNNLKDTIFYKVFENNYNKIIYTSNFNHTNGDCSTNVKVFKYIPGDNKITRKIKKCHNVRMYTEFITENLATFSAVCRFDIKYSYYVIELLLSMYFYKNNIYFSNECHSVRLNGDYFNTFSFINLYYNTKKDFNNFLNFNNYAYTLIKRVLKYYNMESTIIPHSSQQFAYSIKSSKPPINHVIEEIIIKLHLKFNKYNNVKIPNFAFAISPERDSYNNIIHNHLTFYELQFSLYLYHNDISYIENILYISKRSVFSISAFLYSKIVLENDKYYIENKEKIYTCLVYCYMNFRYPNICSSIDFIHIYRILTIFGYSIKKFCYEINFPFRRFISFVSMASKINSDVFEFVMDNRGEQDHERAGFIATLLE